MGAFDDRESRAPLAWTPTEAKEQRPPLVSDANPSLVEQCIDGGQSTANGQSRAAEEAMSFWSEDLSPEPICALEGHIDAAAHRSPVRTDSLGQSAAVPPVDPKYKGPDQRDLAQILSLGPNRASRDPQRSEKVQKADENVADIESILN